MRLLGNLGVKGVTVGSMEEQTNKKRSSRLLWVLSSARELPVSVAHKSWNTVFLWFLTIKASHLCGTAKCLSLLHSPNSSHNDETYLGIVGYVMLGQCIRSVHPCFIWNDTNSSLSKGVWVSGLFAEGWWSCSLLQTWQVRCEYIIQQSKQSLKAMLCGHWFWNKFKFVGFKI